MNYRVSQLAEILNVKDYNRALSDVTILHVETDSRYIMHPESSAFFALQGIQKDGHAFINESIEKGIRVFIVSNYDPVSDDKLCFLKVANVLHALQKLASYHRSKFLIPVIGVTGSNGKTIVKEWLASLLQTKFQICKNPKSYNSQLGVALSVLELSEEHELAIFEAGISTVGEMDTLREMIQPTLGILTNIGDAHQAGFSGIDEKTREKLKLFDGVQKLIYCKDYESIDHHRKNHLNNLSWSQKLQAALQIQKVKKTNTGVQIDLSYNQKAYSFSLAFRDEASLENCMHVLTMCIDLGLTEFEIQSGLDHLHNLSMRLEQKEGINGCILINDSYSLDLKSLQLALQFVDQQNQQLARTLVLTDFAEQKNPAELWSSVAYLLEKYKIQKLIGVGHAIRSIQKYLSKDIKSYFVNTTEALLENSNLFNLHQELILIKGARIYRLEDFFQQLSLSKHDTILEIDLKSVTHNLHVYKSKLKPETKIMAVVKAAAYGSGHYEIARLLEHKKIDYLAVAYPDEGILLRQKGIQLPILVMNTGTSDFNSLFDYRLEPEIFSINQLQRLLQEVGRATPIKIHLKLDTGMHRLGFLKADVEDLCSILNQNKQIQVVSIFSHLSASDQPAFDDFTKEQSQLFLEMANCIIDSLGYKPLLHLLNSGGIARHADLQFDMVRLGIGLYGIDTDPELAKKLEKVHTLKTRVSQIKAYTPGETVSYNRSGKIINPSKIGVLSIGYADGLPRIAGSRAYRLHCGRIAVPLIGVVCMDMCMVDLSAVNQTYDGMEIEIFGKTSPIEELARISDTIPYEILCGITTRVKRVFLQD